MKCVICRNGQTTSGSGTVTLQRGDMTLVVCDVPARVCANCGEEYFDEDRSSALLALAEDATRDGVRVEVRDYLAA